MSRWTERGLHGGRISAKKKFSIDDSTRHLTHLFIDECCEGEIVEEICKVFPDVCVAVLPQTFIVESVYLCDLSRLVISSKNRDTIAVTNFQGHEKSDCLDGVVPAIDIVSHEKVVCVWRVSSDSE